MTSFLPRMTEATLASMRRAASATSRISSSWKETLSRVSTAMGCSRSVLPCMSSCVTVELWERWGRLEASHPRCRLAYSHSERMPARMDAELVRSSGAPSVPTGSGTACSCVKWATTASLKNRERCA